MSTADGGNFTDSSATVEHQAQFSTVMSELITGRTNRRPAAVQRANTTAGCGMTRPDPGPKPQITPRSHSVKRQDSPESDNQLNSVVSSMSDVMDMMMGRSPVVSPNSRRKLDITLPRHLRYSSSSDDSSSSTTTAEEQMRPVKKKIRSRKSSKAGSRPISLARELDLEAPVHARSSRSTIDRKKSSESPKPGGPKLSVCPSRDSLNDKKAKTKPSPDMSKLPSMTSTDMSSSSEDGENDDVFEDEKKELITEKSDENDNIEIFEDLGWFLARPISYWWEIILVFVNASTVLMIWLSLILNLFKEIVSFNSKYFNLSVLIFASGGLLHLLVLPIVTGTLNVSRFLPYIKHSKTSITTRKLVRNWNSKWRIYFLNLVLPWNALFVQSNFNSQANLLCGQIQKCSGELKREIKLKLIDLKKIANEIVIVESSARNPFQLLIGYSIFLQLSSNPLSNASLTVDGKSAILDKGLLYMSCYGLIGTSFLTFVCLCQYFVIWFESCFCKKMSFSIRWMMIFSSSCQIFLALWLTRACSMDFFLLTNPTYLDNAFLALKIFALLLTNFIPVFISKSSSTFSHQIFAELLYYVPAFNSSTFLETGSETLRALLSHILRCAYAFSIYFLLPSSGFETRNLSGLFESTASLVESICEIALFCGPILWIILMYYFLTDLECCKKITFVLFLSLLLCLLLCFIFLVVPRKNYVWETLFDFNL